VCVCVCVCATKQSIFSLFGSCPTPIPSISLSLYVHMALSLVGMSPHLLLLMPVISFSSPLILRFFRLMSRAIFLCDTNSHSQAKKRMSNVACDMGLNGRLRFFANHYFFDDRVSLVLFFVLFLRRVVVWCDERTTSINDIFSSPPVLRMDLSDLIRVIIIIPS
jgi:hypothetical protein